MTPVTLRSARLTLRPWTVACLPAFAALNADPQAMRHFNALLGREDSDAMAEPIRLHADG